MPDDLINVLRKQGALDEEKVKNLSPELLADQGALEEELLKRGAAKEEELVKAKSKILGIPYLDLSNRTIPPDVLRTIPENTVRHYRIVPIEKKGQELIVGMVDPNDAEARKALKFIAVEAHFIPKIYLIAPQDLDHVAGQYRTLGKEVSKALQELEEEFSQERAEDDKIKADEIKELTAEAPITKVVAVTIRHAVESKASDIHIEPLEDKTRVRFRLDGVLHSSLFLPKKIHESVIARIKILANLKLDERRKPQDGRFHANIVNRKIDFRVSTLPTSFGEKVVLRILDPTTGVGKFEDLGLVGPSLDLYKEAIDSPFGLVLITGPTGSGKSTTLYTTLTTVSSEEFNAITLEDPIEYFIEGVNQSQIRPEIGFTFASGLRSILRQDPDIIMVGEIRDRETATLATHAALTGHLVFSTLHTNDALGIIPRFINMGVEPYLIPPTLIAGAAQRLIRRLCEECKEAYEPTPSEQKLIESGLAGVPQERRAEYGLKPPYQLYRSPGCPACGNLGTKGRVAIYEVFKMTRELEQIVLDKISETRLAEEAKRQGMITLREDGIMKALKGWVSLQEVLQTVEAS